MVIIVRTSVKVIKVLYSNKEKDRRTRKMSKKMLSCYVSCYKKNQNTSRVLEVKWSLLKPQHFFVDNLKEETFAIKTFLWNSRNKLLRFDDYKTFNVWWKIFLILSKIAFIKGSVMQIFFSTVTSFNPRINYINLTKNKFSPLREIENNK